MRIGGDRDLRQPVWSERARSAVRAMGERALEVLSPTRCAGCERPGSLICGKCLDAMETIDPVHACTRCGAPFGDMLCTECRGEGLVSGRVLAATTFSGPVPRIIRAYKDGGERRLAGMLASLMLDAAEHAADAAPERYTGMLGDADAVVFVPATRAAFARRGFDHMESIAREFSRMSGIPLIDALAKRDRDDQRDLGRDARAASAEGAYEVVDDVRGARIVLLDDVITTGATVRSAGGRLASVGSRRVDVLAFARVW